MPSIRFKKLVPEATIPRFGRPGDAGIDLHAISYNGLAVEFGKTVSVSTGLAVEIPAGYVGLVCPRSGLAFSHGVTVVNAPGIIDSNYRGELLVVLTKVTPGSHPIRHWDRIAQLVVVPVLADDLVVECVAEMSESIRGVAGFGSSGR